VGSLIACYVLALRLFGRNGALLSCGLYALGASVVSQAITVHPAMLATALFTLLLFALFSLDVAGRRQRAPIAWAVAAGVLWSLLFLTIYSALLLLVPLVWYLIVVTKRDTRAVAAFVLAAIVLNPLTLGCLYRNARLTGNPVFNAHLLELPMDTATYPGASLYRSLGMRQSVPQYLAAGGMGEVGRKAVHNVLGYYQNLPVVLGVFILPLFLIAALTRFTNPAINRLRTLVYAALGLHVLGLSLFVRIAMVCRSWSCTPRLRP
jgi:4-amino-4-deoxy-L-arabinose transferase-like glycosyltransferase